MYIEVLTQISAKAVDQYYTYHVPIQLQDKIKKIGIRVKKYPLVIWYLKDLL
ncbi:MAG: hypothetical protein L6V91_05715 [Bacilli bacterium]|nr:MAG: hypothetical protein L6V91_05715 [Bacilli bacterium]